MGYVLVLGGRGDIGRAIAEALERDAAGRVLAVGTQDFDLTDNGSIDGFLDKNGREVDILVHSAGWNKPDLFEATPFDKVSRTIDINLTGFLYLVQQLIPYWKTTNAARVVVISSLYGFLSRRGRLPYVVAKHGLIGAVKTLAIELASYGVLVNAVSPGYIETKMTTQNNTPEMVETLQQGIPVGRLGRPEDIAKAVAFLVGPENNYITGQDLVVDGGYSIGGFM